MVDLTWNSRGRIGLAEYNKARWRHFAFCVIPIVLFVAGSAGLSSLPIWVGGAAWAVGLVLLIYYRFRFMQLMVRRLHDRGMSGKLILLSPLIQLTVLGGIAAFAFYTAAGDGMPKWIVEGSDLWIWAFIIPAVVFNFFLRYQLSQGGTMGANRYGPPPGSAAAAAVF